MKKHCIVYLCLLYNAISFSQTYRPIPSTGAKWKMEFAEVDMLTDFSVTYFTISDGDTIVAGFPVQKISVSEYGICHYDVTGVLNSGFIYQDSSGKVFQVDPNNGITGKIFDFSLMPGDTMTFTATNFGNVFYRVDSVDTVTFADLIPRKRLYVTGDIFYSTNGLSIWIEGIGDIYRGPIPMATEFEKVLYCLCYKEDSLTLSLGLPGIYCTNDCDQLVKTEVKIQYPNFAVYPNPSNGIWKIKSTSEISHSKIKITVTNIEGKIISQNENVNEIDLREKPSGVYFVSIESENGPMGNYKLMKE